MSQQQRSQPSDVFPVSGDQVAHAEREDVLSRHDTSGNRLSVAETGLPGKRVITASARGQVMAQFVVPAPESEAADLSGDAVTIGEALDVAAVDKPVSRSDTAAVQAAEARATGLGDTVPGGVAAETQAAAELNVRAVNDEDKVKLSDVLTDATTRLPKDKVVTREDAERVKAAEKTIRMMMIRRKTREDAERVKAAEKNNPDDDDQEEEGGVAMAVEAASRMNRPGIV